MRLRIHVGINKPERPAQRRSKTREGNVGGARKAQISTLKSHCQRRLHLRKKAEREKKESGKKENLKQQQTQLHGIRTDNLNENEWQSAGIILCRKRTRQRISINIEYPLSPWSKRIKTMYACSNGSAQVCA